MIISKLTLEDLIEFEKGNLPLPSTLETIECDQEVCRKLLREMQISMEKIIDSRNGGMRYQKRGSRTPRLGY